MTNRFVAIALAVWMISAAFLGLAATAAPPHVVAGGLFGPGVAIGPTNPANAAGFVFYSVNQPAYPLIAGSGFIPANGVDPVLWSEDVGATWTWTPGDEVVVVAETRRGVNGWTDTNRTSSIDGFLQAGPSLQDFGNGTLEALPTLTATAGVDYVQVSWSPLLDANLNVVSYEVFHAVSCAGPWTTSVARVPQGATPSTNQTGLGPGMHCYAVGANYRRDLAGGVYTTFGLSEPVGRTIVDLPPRVTSTSPTNGQINVALASDVVVTFSERMNTGTVTWTIGGGIVLASSWNSPADTIATLTHVTQFAACSPYTVQITAGNDMTGNALVGGGAPNPFTFTAFCPSPFISTTTPAQGATQVRTDATVVIQFSKPMNNATLAVTFVAHTRTWNPTNDRVTLRPTTALTGGILYTVTVTAAQDTGGNALVAGPVPNPWTFTTNRLPTATLTLASGLCVTGGFDLNIPWTMNDTETTPANLDVTLSWIGVSSGPIVGPLAGLTSPYPWTTPLVNGNVQVLLNVADVPGQSAQDNSANVRIDTIAPTVSSLLPADQATNVATDAMIQITFSEAMGRAATQAAILIAPPPTGTASYTWSLGDTVLNITGLSFQPTTRYTITVRTGARDACSPGIVLGAERTSQFTTGAGPKTPNAPTGLAASASGTAIQLTWARPTAYSDGSQFQLSDVDVYIVFRAASATATPVQINTSATPTYLDTKVTAGVHYWYSVKVRDRQNRESAYSAPPLEATAPSGAPEPFPVWVLLIPIIVVLLIVGIWLMRRKKPEAVIAPAKAPPPEEPSGEGVPREQEAPPEESPPEPASERSGEFLACPNCGTMVKPTDAECFVCGAKL